MMKDNSKRKRTRKEMEEVKELEESLKEDRQGFFQQTKRLRQERDLLQQQVVLLSQNQDDLEQLYNQGLVDENGDVIEPPQQLSEN